MHIIKSWVWFYVVLLKLRRAKDKIVACNEISSNIYNLYTININKIKYIYNYLFPNLMWLTTLCVLSVKYPGTTDLLGCAMHRHLRKEFSPFCIFSNLFSVTSNCKISLKICCKVIKIVSPHFWTCTLEDGYKWSWKNLTKPLKNHRQEI